MASTSEIRNGLCIEMNHDIWSVVEFQHVKPGKGAAFVRTKLKSLSKGKVIEQTIPAGHKIDVVRVERRKYQFLYKDDLGYNFMNSETYEQVMLEEKLLDNPLLLKESMELDILFHAEKEVPLTIDVPQYATYEITYTEPGLKGDTATNAMKPATLETGAEVKVPLFINVGDKVKLDTKTAAYVERVKS